MRIRVTPVFLLLAYLIAAAVTFNGFYAKWGFRDNTPWLSAIGMLDGTASRPFVYRQLLPMLANGIDEALPPALKQQAYNYIMRNQHWVPETLRADTPASLRGHILYYLTFDAILIGLFLMRAICLDLGMGTVSATISPVILAGLVPIFQSVGGYFYDFSELCLMAAAVLAALRGTWLLLLVLAAIGTWNKESFFFFLVTLYPLLPARFPRLSAAGLIAGCLGISGVVYLLLRLRYANNPGQDAIFQLWDNLAFYLNPANLIASEMSYSILGARAYSLVSLLLIGTVAWVGWRRLPVSIRRHIALAAAINLPQFVLFCAPGEMRNLSLVYIGFLVLIAAGLARWAAAAEGPRPAVAGEAP